MKLKDIVIARETVEVDAEQSFEVRGVSLADVTILFRTYTEEMITLYQKFDEQRVPGTMVTSQFVEQLAMTALREVPELIFAVVAVAADEPDSVDIFKKLRTSVQVDAITKVVKLSITSEAELKKVMETATNLVQKVVRLLPQNVQEQFADGFLSVVNARTSSSKGVTRTRGNIQ